MVPQPDPICFLRCLRLWAAALLSCVALLVAPACKAGDYTEAEWDEINAKLIESVAGERTAFHLALEKMDGEFKLCHLAFSSWFRDYVDGGGGVATYVWGKLDAIYAPKHKAITYLLAVKTSILGRSLKFEDAMPAYVGFRTAGQAFAQNRAYADLSSDGRAAGFQDPRLQITKALMGDGARLSVEYAFQKTGTLRVIDFVELVGKEAYGAELARFQACQRKLALLLATDLGVRP